MKKFKYIQEFEEWLEPMGYEEFWSAIIPYGLTPDDRSSVDQQIADGVIDEASALSVLKLFARLEMKQKRNLTWRIDVDEMSLH